MAKSLTIAQVATKLSCSESHIRKLVRDGSITAIDISTCSRKQIRIEMDAYEAFLKLRIIEPASKRRGRRNTHAPVGDWF